MSAKDLLEPFERTLRVLSSEPTASIAELVALLGNDVEQFFDYADLGGIDMRGQDLCGFSFHGADLRDAHIGDAIFDAGAIETAVRYHVPHAKTRQWLFRGTWLCRVGVKGDIRMPPSMHSQFIRMNSSRTIDIGVHERYTCLVAHTREYSESKYAYYSERGKSEDMEIELRKSFAAVDSVTYSVSGMFVLPKFFSAKARIGRTAIFMGLGDLVQIWSPEMLLAEPELPRSAREEARHLLELASL
jgi:DNA-binding transcriptional regulator/RsmH inhibitor MraZ